MERLCDEQPMDFWTTSSCASSSVITKKVLDFWMDKFCEDAVSVAGLIEIIRNAKKMRPNAEHRRNLRSHTKISVVSSEYRRKLRSRIKISPRSSGVSRKRSRKGRQGSDSKVVSGSSRPRRRSKRHSKTVSPLRGQLHGSLFDHCFENIWNETPEGKRNPCTYLSSLWFCMYAMEHNREKVLSWIKKQNIFSKRYVFVPIVLWSHWYLLIFCHLGESLDSETRTPCMVLLDSLHKLDPLRLELLIRSLIVGIYRTEGRPESIDMVQKIPLLVPKVPQQRNGVECGIFTLFYINRFLESAPENFSISRGYPYFMKEDWFTKEELERFYERLESFGPEPIDPIPSDLSGLSDVSECSSFGSDGIERLNPDDD